MTDNYSELDEKIAVDDSKKDELIATLQNELTEEKAKRAEERFCWIFLLIIFMDVFFFSGFNTWSGPIVLSALELVLLLILARKYDVQDLTNILDKYVMPVINEKVKK